MEENINENKLNDKRKPLIPKIFKNVSICILAIILGYLHYKYVSQLFENDRSFSYLSELEREMSLRTEMGFYYSYYKTIVDERPFIPAISKLMYDRLVEYPKVVNAFNRFNIHPEIIIGGLYRYFEPWLNTTAHRQCHIVERGQNLSPVTSCIGIGQPIIFYLEAIFTLAGLTVVAIFMFGMTLSESLPGGVLAVVQYFANHSECTRVQWAPNERENLAMPLLILQAWLISLQLRNKEKRTSLQLQVSIVIINCLCLLFWQFTQFIFLTQTAIFFVMEQVRIIDLKGLCILLHSHFCGLHMAVLLLQGNDMLKSSLYMSFFGLVSVYCLFFSSYRINVRTKLDLCIEMWLIVLRVSLVVSASVYVKTVIGDILEVQDDTHIWEILLSKFTSFVSFHTMMYTCSDVFDFLPWSSIENMFKTFLIPFVLLNIFNVCNRWTFDAVNGINKEAVKTADDNTIGEKKDKESDTDDSGIENISENTVKNRRSKPIDLDLLDKIANSSPTNKVESNEEDFLYFLKNFNIDPCLFYNISQMVVYGAMAALVMRLKLLFTTHMCILSSLLFNKSYYVLPKSFMKYLPYFWLLSLMPVLWQMSKNISQEMSHIGEFSDLQQEQLLEWIIKESVENAAFAGSMPLMATVMLTTRRPIVTHPHYEHLEARQRAYSVYKMYGRFPPHEYYTELTKMRVTYLVVETKYCYGRSSKGCSLSDIWDLEAPMMRNRPQLCDLLLTQPVDHFYPVFRNRHYAVFNIHDLSVRYMPRSFDT